MIDSAHAGATLYIDLDALVDNWRAIGERVAPAIAGAVVKADAYGLGAVPVVHALSSAGCRHFFVAHLSEAVALADAVPADGALYILNGLMPDAEQACLDAGAIPILNAPDQIDRWAALARRTGCDLPAVLQVDTGMSRMGLAPEDVEALIADPARLEGIDLRLIMSHFACADEPADPANALQSERFERLSAAFPGVARALDNSGGALMVKPTHFDIVRPGIALYGGAAHNGEPNPMRPVVRLIARIAQVRTIPAGTGVGYGLTFHAQRTTRIATVPVGYADGWPCHLANRGCAYIAGHRAPIAGRVSMDSMTLDVTDIPDVHAQPYAAVELIGPHQSLEDVARDAGTISYEILTRLGHRYAREYRLSGMPLAARERSVDRCG